MRVAFDSRPLTAERGGVGDYSRCLLAALRATAGEQDDVLECSRPRGHDVFHAPWIQGALLRSPCPTVVTIHDLDPLTRRSERLRCGGVHLRLRHLALQRATHVVVPSATVAEEAVFALAIDRERVVVIAPAPLPDTPSDEHEAPTTTSGWSWRDAGRATWQVYARALAEPARACVSRRRGARTQRGSTSGRVAGPPSDLPPSLRKPLPQ